MDILLTRIFDKSDGGTMEVRIGVPVKENDGNGDWMCSYQIIGLGDEKTRTSMGVDSVQAVVLALTYVATSLYCSREYEEGKISWYGGMSLGDLGLPVSDEIRGDIKAKMALVASMTR